MKTLLLFLLLPVLAMAQAHRILIRDASSNTTTQTRATFTVAGDLSAVNSLNFKPSTELTIASGVVVQTQGYHTIDTEGDAATDVLLTITPSASTVDGSLLIIRPENSLRDIDVQAGGNIVLVRNGCTLGSLQHYLVLQYNEAATDWYEVIRGNLGTSDDVTFGGDFTVSGGSILANTGFAVGSSTSVTIASGDINYNSTILSVDTESAAASDDLDTLTVGTLTLHSGSIVILKPANTTRTVVVKHNFGSEGFLLRNAVDFSMDDLDDRLLLYQDSGIGRWVELARCDASPPYYQITDNDDAVENDAAYTLIDDMTVTPAPGIYEVTFSSSALETDPSTVYTVALFSDGSIVQHSERSIETDGATSTRAVVHTQAVITVDGDDVVEAQVDTNAENITFHERSLILRRIN